MKPICARDMLCCKIENEGVSIEVVRKGDMVLIEGDTTYSEQITSVFSGKSFFDPNPAPKDKKDYKKKGIHEVVEHPVAFYFCGNESSSNYFVPDEKCDRIFFDGREYEVIKVVTPKIGDPLVTTHTEAYCLLIEND